MKIDDLSAVILTYNEEENIERVLLKLKWLKKVYVVDSYSTDKTHELCLNHSNVTYLTRKFDNHASQWNYGLEFVTTPWVLTLDADYVLDDDWEEEWRKLDAQHQGYLVSFRYIINDRPLSSALYPSKVVLFQKEHGTFIQDGHTQRLLLKGTVGRFPAKISHDDRKKLVRWLSNQVKYADLESDKILSNTQLTKIDKIRKTAWLMPILIVPYCLIIIGLLFDGKRGWIYTLQRLVAETLISLMILEKKSNEEKQCKDIRS